MYISMNILNVHKKVLGVIILFEVATHRPPILFLPVDGVLVDCYLCFAHRWTGMAPSYKEMSLQLRKRALGLLLSQLKDGVLLWGSLTIVADEIGVACSTISRLWRQACGAREQSLIITPEIASQNNSHTNCLKYSHTEFRQGLKEIPRHHHKTLFHSENNGGRIEYSATNVVAPRCLSHPHVFPKAYIDRREQDVKDGVGLIIR